MAIVLGLDSSTQSLSAIVLDTEAGSILWEETVRFGEDLPAYNAPHGFIPDSPSGQVHADPMMWLDALDLLFARIKSQGFDLQSIRAISGAGQQHGSVYLDASFSDRLSRLEPKELLSKQLTSSLTRPTSPIWMDGTTTTACRQIEEKLGGPLEVCRRSGSVAIRRFTGPQIRQFYQQSPEQYQATARIHLVSSFLASVMTGSSSRIDRGDGAGMNLMNLSTGGWDADLVEATAPDLASKLPALADSATVIGNIAPYFVNKYGFSEKCLSVLWTGDNPSSLVGMGAAQPGKVVISLGTSDTLFAALTEPLTDPNGFGHVFGNPWGEYMSLVCFRNGSLAREALRDELSAEWSDFEAAVSRPPLAKEVMLPFVEPEITPRTDGAGLMRNSSSELSTLERIRLLLEGQFLNMRLHSVWMQLQPDVIYVTGGASANQGICQVIADVFGAPVKRLSVSGSVCLGAGMRAAEAAFDESKQRLESLFCPTDPDSKIEPNRSLSPIYDNKLQEFAQLVRAL
jgi:xylulokinase